MPGKSSGKSKKHGRNKEECKLYRTNERREKNKAYKLIKHLELFPFDECAISRLKKIPPHCVKYAKNILTQRRGYAIENILHN